MSESDQLAALDRLHRCFEAEGVEYWLLGGWAVDFHVGTVTRAHSDLDLAIWLPDLPRVATLLRREGWAHEPEDAEAGSTAFTQGTVRVELAFLQRDGADGEPYTPLADGGRAGWATGAFGQDVLTLAGIRARVIAFGGAPRGEDRRTRRRGRRSEGPRRPRIARTADLTTTWRGETTCAFRNHLPVTPSVAEATIRLWM